MFLVVANVVVLYLLVPNAMSWIALALFLASGYAAGGLLRGAGRSGHILYFVALLTAFMVLKKYSLFGYVIPARLLDHPVAIVGISYMLFRQIHFVVDSIQGQFDRQS